MNHLNLNQSTHNENVKGTQVSDTIPFKDFHIKEVKSALDAITHSMNNVRAKKHWQKEELDVLKYHRRVLSGCLSMLQNNEEVSYEQLLSVDEMLDDYNDACIS